MRLGGESITVEIDETLVFGRKLRQGTKAGRKNKTVVVGMAERDSRIAGVDLTDVPRVSAITAQVILTEIGPDVSRFRPGKLAAQTYSTSIRSQVAHSHAASCIQRAYSVVD